MNLTYSLIPGGYQVFLDGKLWIHQPFRPDVPGYEPYATEAAAQEAAEARIAELLTPPINEPA